MFLLSCVITLQYAFCAFAQVDYSSPIAQRCPGLEDVNDVACVNRYASVLPPPFSRVFGTNCTDPVNDSFVATSVPSDPSFAILWNATFIVFDEKRSRDIMSSSAPKLEHVFDTRNDSIHEAPVYVPALNVIIFSLAHQGIYEQRIINLNNTPPTIDNYTTSPPVYAVNGGKLYKDRIYWASEASFSFPSPSTGETVRQAPGIYMLNPYTNETVPLVNNYFGRLFNSPNDVFIDSNGDVFFTDSWYGYAINATAQPRIPTATYRFRPSTGAISVVEDTLDQPNGIAISPDGRYMYLSDTGVLAVPLQPEYASTIPRMTYDPFAGSRLYAYDIHFSNAGNYITNKRPLASTLPFTADGLHVSREGYIVGASGSGVTIFTALGEIVMRIEVGGSINQCQFAGEDLNELWLFGPGGIFKVTGLLGLHGMGDE